MSKSQAAVKSDIRVEEYRGVLFQETVNVPMTPQELAEVWATNSMDDSWFLIAHSRNGETWCAKVLGTDNNTACDIVVGLIRELIVGSIIDEPIPESIEVLKHPSYMEDGVSCDLAGIAMQLALQGMKKRDIPEEYKLHWME